MKVSSTFSTGAGSRDRVPGRAPQSAELSLCFIKRRRGSKGEPSPGVPPSFLFLHFLRVRRYVGRFSLPRPAFRPHFFGACPKKRCRAAKEKRFFYPGGSTIRVSASASVIVTHLRPTWGGGGCGSRAFYVCADTLGGCRCPALRFDPISFVLPKETVSSRQRKALFLPRWLHHSRERYCFVVGTFLARLGEGAGVGLGLSTCAPIRWEVFVALPCDSTPFLWCLPKETVSSRQRKALLTPPHHLGGPARLSPLGVSPNGTNWCVKLICTRWVDRALKSA